MMTVAEATGPEFDQTGRVETLMLRTGADDGQSARDGKRGALALP